MPETVSSEPNKTMGYRAGEEKDLEGIMAVIHDAQRTMGEAGLDQWQDGYPSEEIIRDDIRNGESRVWEEDGTILGTAMLSFRGEPVRRSTGLPCCLRSEDTELPESFLGRWKKRSAGTVFL